MENKLKYVSFKDWLFRGQSYWSIFDVIDKENFQVDVRCNINGGFGDM